MINKADLSELQRLATNFYDDDKKFVRRIIHQVNLMDREITKLQTENEALKKEISDLKGLNGAKT